MNSSLTELLLNVSFWAAVIAWCVAQFTKLLCHLVVTREVRLDYIVSTGGMPSAHSATVCALATSIGLGAGFGSSIFALSLIFAMLTMFDASTVRQAAGKQARILNEMIRQFFADGSFSETKLKEFLGHTRLEVAAGMVIGILTALLVNTYPIFSSHPS